MHTSTCSLGVFRAESCTLLVVLSPVHNITRLTCTDPGHSYACTTLNAYKPQCTNKREITAHRKENKKKDVMLSCKREGETHAERGVTRYSHLPCSLASNPIRAPWPQSPHCTDDTMGPRRSGRPAHTRRRITTFFIGKSTAFEPPRRLWGNEHQDDSGKHLVFTILQHDDRTNTWQHGHDYAYRNACPCACSFPC